MYQIKDCLSDEIIAIEQEEQSANELCRIHGGADNCIHVFPVLKAEAKIEPRVKPKEGELF